METGGNMLTYGVLDCEAVPFCRQVPIFREQIYFLYLQGRNMSRAITQAVSRRFPTAAAQVRAQGQVMWDLWSTKRDWGRFSLSTLVSAANSHFTDCSTLIIIIIIIYHPGLVQYAKHWPTYQVDSVSPHPKKLNKKGRNI
jgi:hypothetical protein